LTIGLQKTTLELLLINARLMPLTVVDHRKKTFGK